MQIYSFSPFGYEGALVSVEVDLRRGIPAIDIVGLADGAVKESRERMRSAIRNCGFEFPPERVLISLSPADLKKEGAGFDLAIALSVLHAKQKLENEHKTDNKELEDDSTLPILVIGELELNGKVRPVRGIYAAVNTAYAGGIRLCIVPSANSSEAREVLGMKVFGAQNLEEAFTALSNRELFSQGGSSQVNQNGVPKNAVLVEDVLFNSIESGYEFAEVKKQPKLVRALQIAASGGHNLLAFGPPGCGKTLALQRFSSLMPLLSLEEAQPVTRIYSIAGLLPPGNPLIRTPPFRQPHQTASMEGICGGGPRCSPGEISLAHNGVLFLDEAAEFKTSVLQMLRVPLESGSVTLSRAGRSSVFPSNFQLLMATNPCPCGNYGSKEKICLCSARSIEQYWRKFSAPLLDRIDIRVQVDTCAESTEEKSLSTAELRVKIARATLICRKRQGSKKNAHLTPTEIAKYCPLESQAKSLLDFSAERFVMSPRAVSGCIKLARTIADMEQKELIDESCMKEAISYRKVSGGVEAGLSSIF